MSSSISSSSADPVEPAGQPAARYLGWIASVAAATFALTWLYVALMPMAFLSRDYPLWMAKKTMMEACNMGSVAVFGDSRAVAAIMPRAMPVDASNLAMSGTSPIETYFAVKHALRCAKPPELVILAHGPAKFGGDANFWDDGPLIGFLGYSELREIDEQAAKLNDTGDLGTGKADGLWPAAKDWLYDVRFPSLYFASLANGLVGGRWWHNRNAYAEALQARGHALFGTNEGSSALADESTLGQFTPSPLVDFYFTKTISLLRDRGIKTVFIAMPLNQSTYDKIDRRVEAGLSTYLRAKESEFANFRLIGDPVSCWPDAAFGDGWHFNRKGAEAYSRELGAWLRAFTAGGPMDGLRDHCVRSNVTASVAGP